ncbi:MAG: hypothetical protein QNJ08_02210 [Crocosphaera sp.]|nr:hypothetical protein [Crocosphaera sp.]
MRLVMLGGPGSGKATQSQRLSQHFNVPINPSTSTMKVTFCLD